MNEERGGENAGGERGRPAEAKEGGASATNEQNINIERLLARAASLPFFVSFVLPSTFFGFCPSNLPDSMSHDPL